MPDQSPTVLESLSCNSCGAPLQVPQSANFVTCHHCQTQLAIRRTPSASYTEQLEGLSRKTDELSAQIRHLAWQNELATIDREWEQEQQRHMINGKHGKRLPNPGVATITGGALAVLGGLLFLGGLVNGAPQLLIGIVMAVVGVGAAFYEHNKSRDYRAARARHLRRRASVTPENVNLDRYTSPFTADGPGNIPTPDEYLRELQRDDSE